MESTRLRSRAERVAPNVWLRADGGFIFAGVPHVVTSGVVILRRISMRRNIMPPRVTRSSQVSSRVSGGFTIIVRNSSSAARSCSLLIRIRRSNRCPDRTGRCLLIGKRCFMTSGRLRSRAASSNALYCLTTCRRARENSRHSTHRAPSIIRLDNAALTDPAWLPPNNKYVSVISVR
jgi:hypothetical protein